MPTKALAIPKSGSLVANDGLALPAIISASGPQAEKRFLEFFLVTIRNPSTRKTYARSISAFCAWLAENGIRDLTDIEPIHVAAYVEGRGQDTKPQTVKKDLAAIRTFLSWLVTGHFIAMNPAADVKAPAFSRKTGSTQPLTPEQTRLLLDSIPTDTIVGLRDRALIGTMAYTFARISAALGVNLGDLIQGPRSLQMRFFEKGGKEHVMPCHHELVGYLDAYLGAASFPEDPALPLFPSATRQRVPVLTSRRLNRRNALDMVKRRAVAAGLDRGTGNHTFRATGITTYLEEGGVLEEAQNMAGHADSRTTRIYDHRDKTVLQAHVERIRY